MWAQNNCRREWSSSFSRCLCLDSVLDLSFPCWESGKPRRRLQGFVGRRHRVCEAWIVSECCVTPRQGHGGTISSVESVAVLFLMPYLLTSPRTVFCQELAWGNLVSVHRKEVFSRHVGFPLPPKRLFCQSKAAPWRCLSLR